MGPVHRCRLSVLLLNMLFRIGLQGDVDRDREAAARVYFEEHGRWPDEEVRPTGRRWRLDLNRGGHRAERDPIDEHCPCPACREHTRAYLHYLVRAGELTHEEIEKGQAEFKKALCLTCFGRYWAARHETPAAAIIFREVHSEERQLILAVDQ